MKKRFYYKFLSCTFLGALGEYMALATLSWYLLENYNQLSIIGKVLSFRIIPRFFMGFVGGYLADIYNRKRMMIFIYGGIMCVSLLQTIFVTLLHQPAWYLLAGILFIRSIFDGMEPSVRNALLPVLVDTRTISKAIGYYATGLNLAAILAPMLAAFMMSSLHINMVFWIDWVFQIPSFIVLFFIPNMQSYMPSRRHQFVKAYKEVIQFVYATPLLLNCIATSILMMIVIFPFGAMLSMYVKDGLKLSVSTYGFLSGIEAAGAVLSGVLISRIFHMPEKAFLKWYTLALLAGICLILLSVKPQIILVYLLIFIFGFLTQLFRSFSRIIFQQHTPDHIKGKIMSIIISDSGFISIGLLLFTFLADTLTIEKCILYMGIAAAIIMFVVIIVYLNNREAILETRNRVKIDP